MKEKLKKIFKEKNKEKLISIGLVLFIISYVIISFCLHIKTYNGAITLV